MDVYTAATERLKFIFDSFDNVYVSFSGGKDSGALLNLALAEARLRRRKIGVFHIDYEAQYTATTDYVDSVYNELADEIEPLRCCVPVRCSTSTSMFESFWRPWDPDKKHLWVRDRPNPCLHSFDFITPDMTDYAFQSRFGTWYHEQSGASRTCVLVGIRAQESLDRWRVITGANRVNMFSGKSWTTRSDQDVYNAYPLYDWTTEDIWTAHARFGWTYNNLYTLMHLAGVPLSAMRVASPFHNFAKSSLSLYRAIDPHMWGRMVSRVNGVNFTALYGGTKAMGWRTLEKPDHFTWQQYALFLLSTLPEKTASNFRSKLAVSVAFWRDKGGCLSSATIEQLRKAGVAIEVVPDTNYRTPKKPAKMEYMDDWNGSDFSDLPTWKRICLCILKNDHVGKYMGFALNKNEMKQREEALERYAAF
jgi:predicted phosphoadenosine phosphosulfate sulfurtransferase